MDVAELIDQVLAQPGASGKEVAQALKAHGHLDPKEQFRFPAGGFRRSTTDEIMAEKAREDFSLAEDPDQPTWQQLAEMRLATIKALAAYIAGS